MHTQTNRNQTLASQKIQLLPVEVWNEYTLLYPWKTYFYLVPLLLQNKYTKFHIWYFGSLYLIPSHYFW